MCMTTPLSWNGGVAPYLLRIFTSVAINTQQQLEVFPIFLIPPLSIWDVPVTPVRPVFETVHSYLTPTQVLNTSPPQGQHRCYRP